MEKELKPVVSGRVVESVKLAADLSVNCGVSPGLTMCHLSRISA